MSVAVAIASFRDARLLQACLDALVPQAAALQAPITVARPPGDALGPQLAARYPGVRFVSAAGADIPRLRGAALAEAGADLVAVTEDHCVAAPGWLQALVDAHDRTAADVIGGGMGNAQQRRVVDWAAYFSEYGFFAWTRPAGPQPSGVELLTGANVAYARAVLPAVAAWTQAGDWENVCHDRLHAQGRRLLFVPDARVLQNHTYRFAAFCVDRYEHGRDYARVRLSTAEGPARLKWLATTPLLAPLLTLRVGRAAAGLAPVAYLRALPVTLAFLGAWALGEAVGYATGEVRR